MKKRKIETVDDWLREHALARDEFVLGNKVVFDSQLPDLYKLLDIVRPGWRSIVRVGN